MYFSLPADGYLGHLYGTTLHLTGHQNLWGHHLTKECQHRGSVPHWPMTITPLHECLTQLSWRRSDSKIKLKLILYKHQSFLTCWSLPSYTLHPHSEPESSSPVCCPHCPSQGWPCCCTSHRTSASHTSTSLQTCLQHRKYLWSRSQQILIVTCHTGVVVSGGV